jgi:hypothetical protein
MGAIWRAEGTVEGKVCSPPSLTSWVVGKSVRSDSRLSVAIL